LPVTSPSRAGAAFPPFPWSAPMVATNKRSTTEPTRFFWVNLDLAPCIDKRLFFQYYFSQRGSRRGKPYESKAMGL
jgi:hypothetical protein